MTYDAVINNGLWFDGTGAKPAVRNLGIRDGVGYCHLPRSTRRNRLSPCNRREAQVGDPGHRGTSTLTTTSRSSKGPALSESLRHGVTSIFVGSCSLSTISRQPLRRG